MVQDARKFIFSSDNPMPYFVYYTTHTVVALANTTTSTQISHGLPFTPLLVGYWSDSSDFSSANDVNAEKFGAGGIISARVKADAENIYIDSWNSGDSPITIHLKLWAYAPPDYDGQAEAVTDYTKFYFDTDCKYLELAKSGIATEQDSPSEVEHGLGYIPQCRVWRRYRIGGKEYVEPQDATLFPDETYANNASFWANESVLHLGRLASNAICYYYHIYTSEGL